MQTQDYCDNQSNTMNNLINNYAMLMRQAEQANSRRAAKKLKNLEREWLTASVMTNLTIVALTNN